MSTCLTTLKQIAKTPFNCYYLEQPEKAEALYHTVLKVCTLGVVALLLARGTFYQQPQFTCPPSDSGQESHHLKPAPDQCPSPFWLKTHHYFRYLGPAEFFPEYFAITGLAFQNMLTGYHLIMVTGYHLINILTTKK